MSSKRNFCSPGADSSRTTACPIGLGDSLNVAYLAVLIVGQVLLEALSFFCIFWTLTSVLNKGRAWAKMVV